MIDVMLDYHKPKPKKANIQTVESRPTIAAAKPRSLEILAELLESPLSFSQIRTKYQLSATWAHKLARIQRNPELVRKILEKKMTLRAGIRAVTKARNHLTDLWNVSTDRDRKTTILKTIDALFRDGDISQSQFQQISKALSPDTVDPE